MEIFKQSIEWIGAGMEAAGVLIVVIGALVATARFLFTRSAAAGGRYRGYREDLGKAILLGLEFLVAGDIIRTVAVSPTFESVAVLGLIVLIRTLLSMSIEVELEGRWPWRRAEAMKSQKA